MSSESISAREAMLQRTLSASPLLANSKFRNLDAEEVESTLQGLMKRIEERFPKSSLAGVCNEVHEVAQHSRERAEKISKPLYGLRVAVGAFLICLVLGAAYTSTTLKMPDREFGITDLVQLLDSALNDIVIIAAATFSLLTLETRIKRKRALRALHDLRSLAHIIDMHQLTKDPNRIVYPKCRTESSPDEPLNAFELGRYLNYCSEMLALTGKVAAIYAASFYDEVVISAVNDIETLTSDLSRKIWQKLMILQSVTHDVIVA